MPIDKYEELVKKSKDEYISKVKPVTDAAIDKLKAKGYKVNDASTLGMLSVDMTPKELKNIEDIEEIDSIFDGETKNIPALASARLASGLADVNNRKINADNVNGKGVRIAQIEFGGLLPTNNPYLPMSSIIQNTTFACGYYHNANVAGIMKSTNLANMGVATGATLWAGGSCSGDNGEFFNRAYQAVVNEGASAINLSWGCIHDTSTINGITCNRYPSSNPSLYDSLSFYSTHPSIINSAANNGSISSGDGTYNVYGIATGYNVMTVGNYDDKNNNDVYDDTINNTSSWKNPTNVNGDMTDREKPEVVAPGTDVWTTGYNPSEPILINVSGTSFSAPIVTGGSAVLMQRSAYLKSEPELLKAIILATARNDVAKDGQLPSGDPDKGDGYGGVDFNWADRLLLGQTSGSSFSVVDNLDCKTNPYGNPKIIPMAITKLGNVVQPYRAFFVVDISAV